MMHWPPDPSTTRDYASPHSSADEAYDSDEAPELELDLARLRECATAAVSARCVNVRKLTRGRFHEIFLLDFEPSVQARETVARAGFSCIARLTRSQENEAKATSELATMRYVRGHTSIPVAEILYADLNTSNPVGAPFVLMERLPGQHLYKIWDGLPLKHKKAVLVQITEVLAQLAALKFDRIGSLYETGLGPLVDPCLDKAGPFTSTFDYLSAFIDQERVESPDLKHLYGQIRDILDTYLAAQRTAPFLNPPYGLIHPDFDAQNLLFMQSPDPATDPPRLSGVLDFEYAHTGPLYFLYEYPIFIQDVDHSPEDYEENAVLRPYFVRALRRQFQRGSADEITARDTMRGRSFILNEFKRIFTLTKMDDTMMQMQASSYLQEYRNGTGKAYTGRPDYIPDVELASDED